MKHGPSHLFPDHVVVNLTLQEYEAFGNLMESVMGGGAIPVRIDRRKGQRRTFEWMRRRKPERRK